MSQPQKIMRLFKNDVVFFLLNVLLQFVFYLASLGFFHFTLPSFSLQTWIIKLLVKEVIFILQSPDLMI